MNPKDSRYYTYIKPIINNKKIQTYSGLVFSIITVSIFAFFAIRPTISTIIGLQKSIQEQEEILTTLSQKSSNINTGKTNYDTLDLSVKENIELLFPEKVEIARLIDNLNSLANKYQASVSGLQFQQIDLIPTTRNPKNLVLKEMDFNFNLQGKYPELVKILAEFTSADRLIQIDSVSINQSSDRNLLMTINAKAFYLKGD